jgi:hypothetical protein
MKDAVDSGFDNGSVSDMTSITGSTYAHRYGKRGHTLLKPLIDGYHGITSNPYPLPNDEEEKERLDELQYCYRTLFGTNILAPIRKKPTQIGSILLIQV